MANKKTSKFVKNLFLIPFSKIRRKLDAPGISKALVIGVGADTIYSIP